MSEPEIETVRRMAALARLDIGDEEARLLARQFERTLQHFQVLAQVDVAGAEQMTGAARGHDVQRADEPRAPLAVDAALANAPDRSEDYYRVPKTVGGEE